MASYLDVAYRPLSVRSLRQHYLNQVQRVYSQSQPSAETPPEEALTAKKNRYQNHWLSLLV